MSNRLSAGCEAELDRFDMRPEYDDEGEKVAVFSVDDDSYLFLVTLKIDARDLKEMLRYGDRKWLQGEEAGRRGLSEQLRNLINAAPLEP